VNIPRLELFWMVDVGIWRFRQLILLEGRRVVRQIFPARAHGLWTYKPRQGRKAATVVRSASAVVTLAPF